MAESNQRKIADPIDLDENDPFAELTRIMGFDPRKLATSEPKVLVGANNAKPSMVAPTPSNAPAFEARAEPDPLEAEDDDFGIDLEKELLGGFDDFDLPVEPSEQASLPTPAPAPINPPVAAAAPAAAMHAPAMPANPPVAAAPVAAATHAPVMPAKPPVAAVPDAVVTSAPANETALDGIDWEPMEAELAAAAQSLDRDYEVGRTHGETMAAPIAAESAAIADDGMDDDLAAELDRHFAELQPQPAMSTVPAPAARTAAQSVSEKTSAAPSSPAVQRAAEHNSAPAVDDDLLAELDLADFDLHRDGDVEDDADEPQVVADPVAVVEDAGAELALAPEATSLDTAEAGDAFADVDMDFSAALEAELDGSEAHAPAIAKRAPARQQAVAAVAPDHGARAQAAATLDDHFELSLEDEISALLESDDAEPEAVEAKARPPLAAPAAVAAAERSRGHFLSDPRWAALAGAEEDEPVDNSSRAAIDRRPFADSSLTGRHANFQMPQQRAAEPSATDSIDDLDDLLDAMEHETHSADHGPAPIMAAAAPAPDARGTVSRSSEGQTHVAGYAGDAAAEAGYDAVPEIETVDVPEAAVAVADDLDLPDLVYEEDERQQPASYDDIDADFAASFNKIATSEEPVSQSVRGTARPNERAHQEVDFSALYRTAGPQAEPGAAIEEIDFEPLTDEEPAVRKPRYDDEPDAPTPDSRFVDLDFGGDAEDDRAEPVAVYQQVERPRRGGTLLIAALVGGVALLGGAGAYALSHYGGEKSDVPALVKADAGPVKVKPENPGGTAVPNQDNKVYDAVKGAAAEPSAPQPRLVTTQEEPVDVGAVDKAEAAEAPDALPGVGTADALPGVEKPASQPQAGTADALPGVNDADNVMPKAEDRVDPVADADQDMPVDDSISVSPRRVKTMVVRSDGTLVPRDEPAAAADSETSDALAAGDQALMPANDQTGAVDASDDGPSFQSPGGDPVPVKTVKSTKLNGEGKAQGDTVAPKAVRSSKVDANGKPQAASEPSALPPAADAAAEPRPQPEAKAPQPKPAAPVKPEEVAAANVEPTAIANGAWSVQIASQPSADSAKSTYQDLAQRYGSVIGGRGVNIVKADIEGKGTYWRVRVPAKSRNDAIGLCNDYKAAGGNCFVSK